MQRLTLTVRRDPQLRWTYSRRYQRDGPSKEGIHGETDIGQPVKDRKEQHAGRGEWEDEQGAARGDDQGQEEEEERATVKDNRGRPVG